MATEAESSKNQQPPGRGKVETRTVFISHAHADRKLADQLRELIETALSGVVKGYTSSDPTPTGGLMPGDEWYSEIHAHLASAEAVWVLATHVSIERPWIYWEAGIGKATCPGAVVVLRVGLSPTEVVGPLSNFQSYDGLKEESVRELVGKVGAQIGMTIPRLLIDALAKNWVEAAAKHEPETEGQTPAPKLLPEQLSQFDSSIARLESAIDSLRTPRQVEARLPARVRVAAEERDQRKRRALGDVLVNFEGKIFYDVEEFINHVAAVPEDAALEFDEIDSDRDALVVARSGDSAVRFYLSSGALVDLVLPADAPSRTRALVRSILEARDTAQ